MDMAKMLAELIRDEGLKLKPYLDSKGIETIGIGRNLKAVGISEAEARLLCANDITRTMAELDEHLPWWRSLSEVRQRVILNMGFNMGVDGDPKNPNDALTGFRATLELVRTGKYEDAANHMLATLWARQVGARARRLAAMMRTGTEPGSVA